MQFSFPPASLREFDRQMAAEGNGGLETLMCHAGRRVAEAAEEIRQARGDRKCAVLLVGKGNNGGDALVAARLLHADDWNLQVVLVCPPHELPELPKSMFALLPEAIRQSAVIADTKQQLIDTKDTIIIDGLLGTGFNGQMPREPLATLIHLANDSRRPILAIDIPSGLNGETGEAELCIRATATVCLCAVKTGLLVNQGIASAGRLIVAPLPGQDLLATLPHGPAVFGNAEARELVPQIAFDTHKFKRGAVAVIGGSRQYGGAPLLAGTAALHAGAGLVQVLLPAKCEPSCSYPKALIVQCLSDTDDGVLSADSLSALTDALDRATALAVGPGLTRSPAVLPVLAELFGMGKPLVVDADALNLLSSCPALLTQNHANEIVLTPHAGEFARLQAAFELKATGDRAKDAVALAKRTRCVVVLKGARTIIAAPDGSYSYNLSGCPALATAGSGDVLTGVIAALLANGLRPYDAARLGAWLHGAAAEHATRPGAPLGLIADDLPRLVGTTLADLY